MKLLYSLKKVQQGGWLIWGLKYQLLTMGLQEQDRPSDVFVLERALHRQPGLEGRGTGIKNGKVTVY